MLCFQSPFLVQSGRNKLSESGGLDVALLPKLVHVVLENKSLVSAEKALSLRALTRCFGAHPRWQDLQSLCICAQSCQSKIKVVVYPVHFLEITSQCLELDTES